jgi:opacity protein-like surface antigen
MSLKPLFLGVLTGASLVVHGADSESKNGFYTKFGAGAVLQDDLAIKEMPVDGVNYHFPVTLEGQELADFLDALGYEISVGEGVSGTISKPKFKTDTGLHLDLAAGYHISESWAVELQTGLNYSSLECFEIPLAFSAGGDAFTDSIRVDDLGYNLYQVPLLANVIYTVPLKGRVKPYVGVGAGGVVTVLDADGSTENDFTYAWQVQAGANYRINERWSAGLAYKLMGTGENDWSGAKVDSFLSHSLSATVSLEF